MIERSGLGWAIFSLTLFLMSMGVHKGLLALHVILAEGTDRVHRK